MTRTRLRSAVGLALLLAASGAEAQSADDLQDVTVAPIECWTRTSARSVRVVHGIGTGALKRAVAAYLTTSPYCRAFADAAPPEGGAGVTVVEIL